MVKMIFLFLLPVALFGQQEVIQEKATISGLERVYLHETDGSGNRIYVTLGTIMGIIDTMLYNENTAQGYENSVTTYEDSVLIRSQCITCNTDVKLTAEPAELMMSVDGLSGNSSIELTPDSIKLNAENICVTDILEDIIVTEIGLNSDNKIVKKQAPVFMEIETPQTGFINLTEPVDHYIYIDANLTEPGIANVIQLREDVVDFPIGTQIHVHVVGNVALQTVAVRSSNSDTAGAEIVQVSSDIGDGATRYNFQSDGESWVFTWVGTKWLQNKW